MLAGPLGSGLFFYHTRNFKQDVGCLLYISTWAILEFSWCDGEEDIELCRFRMWRCVLF
jgi:hypothetical protein